MNTTEENSEPFYTVVSFQFIIPFFEICGIVGNSWILLTLIFGNVKISKTTKLYYLIIGIGDLILVANIFVWVVLCGGLLIWTNGKLGFCWDTVSLFACWGFNLSFYWAEIVSDYALMALSIERFIAVCYPLKAKSILTKKFSFYLLFFLIVPLLVFYSFLILFGSRIVKSYVLHDSVCSFDYQTIFGLAFRASMPIIILGLHTIVDFIVTCALFTKLYISRRKSELTSTSQKGTKELTATVVLITLCTCTMVIYGMALVVYLISTIIKFVSVSEQFYVHIHKITITLLSLTPVPHSINIFIYLAFIPSFRHSAFCKLYNVAPRKEATTT